LEYAISQLPQSQRADFLDDLGMEFLERFQRTGHIDDVNQAIVLEHMAIELTSEELPEHPGRLNHLGAALQSRFERAGSMDDLDRAIEINEQAVKLTSEDHPDCGM